MGKVTFVVEFEDGKEPTISAGMEILGGRLIAGRAGDYKDDYFTEDETNFVMEALDVGYGDEDEAKAADAIISKMELMTL